MLTIHTATGANLLMIICPSFTTVAVYCVAVTLDDNFEDALQSFVRDCDNKNVPCVFALGRKALGRACAKPVPVSVIGIRSYTGAEVLATAQFFYFML